MGFGKFLLGLMGTGSLIYLCESLNLTKFEGYGLSSETNTTEYCPFDYRECATKCLYNSSCIAIALEDNKTRCEGARLAYFGSLPLEMKNHSNVWVKSMPTKNLPTFLVSHYSELE